MGTQSTAKTIFLLLSVVGWLGVGATLIYLSPWMINLFNPSDTTHTWLETLGRSGYSPKWGLQTGGIDLALTVIGNVVWYSKFEGKI
ncbi:MAG: hypothetical protein AAFZ80_05215 [Cyanobacteria bacterium P01_A01_bin.105]